jgi:protein phosphatase
MALPVAQFGGVEGARARGRFCGGPAGAGNLFGGGAIEKGGRIEPSLTALQGAVSIAGDGLGVFERVGARAIAFPRTMAGAPKSASLEGSPGGAVTLEGRVAVATDTGKVRSNNEDNYLVFDLQKRAALGASANARIALAGPALLVGVADGMGGHNSGQVASQVCVETLPNEFLKNFPENPDGADFTPALVRAVTATNDHIYKMAKSDQQYEGMGTTLTAALFSGAKVWVAQVGDSRAYLLHDGQIEQLTRDQTLFNSLREEERQALKETPFENMLLQAVGAMTRLEVVVTTAEAAPGDTLLLCSDGLYKVVNAEEIRDVLRQNHSLQQKADALVKLALDGGGPDNVTVVLCEVAKAGD